MNYRTTLMGCLLVGFPRRLENMFAQIVSAFDGCRDMVTAAVTEQRRTTLEFQ